MKIGSLFSGIGGIELGFEREGFTTEWFVEKEPFCQAVLRKHWPKTPIYSDITSVDFSKLPKVDMLTGGFPCQDISIAGKGVGISGKRSGLWKEYAKAIRILRPKYAVIENVPMLAQRGLNVVLADLAEAGYDAEWFDLRASDFGALHKRERIFIIAYTCGFGCLERESEINASKTRKQTLGKLNESITSNTSSERWNDRCNNGEERQILSAEKREVEKEEQTRNRRQLRSNENASFVSSNNFKDRIQRFTEETLSRNKGGFCDFKDVKRIEDLQGRPDIPQPIIWGKGNGISCRMDRTKAIGNSVVPQVAQFVARQIKEREGC